MVKIHVRNLFCFCYCMLLQVGRVFFSVCTYYLVNMNCAFFVALTAWQQARMQKLREEGWKNILGGGDEVNTQRISYHSISITYNRILLQTSFECQTH